MRRSVRALHSPFSGVSARATHWSHSFANPALPRTTAPSTWAPVRRTSNSFSGTINSAKPQSRQTEIFGNTHTMGLFRPSRPWKCSAISLVNPSRRAEEHCLHLELTCGIDNSKTCTKSFCQYRFHTCFDTLFWIRASNLSINLPVQARDCDECLEQLC